MRLDKSNIEVDVAPGEYSNELFYGCYFNDLRGLTLVNCDLNKSKFTTDSVDKAMGLALSLNCHSFKGVEYSPLLFNLLLYLLTLTVGNSGKRQALIGIIGEGQYSAFERLLGGVE